VCGEISEVISGELVGAVSDIVSEMLVSGCELGESERSIGEDAVSPGCVADEVVGIGVEVGMSDDCEVV
jgi:VIT1/CCC1 family predicted Fe2+/Mn2+ transporter